MQQREHRQFRKHRSTMLACVLAVAALAAFIRLVGSSAQASTAAQGAPTLPATITVTNTEDGGPGSLRDAIATAASGDTINFDVFGTISLTSGPLTINKDLTLRGPSRELRVQRKYESPEFKVLIVDSGATVAISFLSFNNGATSPSAVGDTGAVIDNHGTLTLDGCVVSGGHAFSGAGIHNAGTLSLNNCWVGANHAESNGGGVLNDGLMTITRSNVVANKAGRSVLGSGGGINNNGTLTINDSHINSNVTETDGSTGAGIANNGTLTLNNSALWDNSARVDGGAIYNSSKAVINNSIITRNGAGATIGKDSARGGGIYNHGGDLSINASTITQNRAERQFDSTVPSVGGGVYRESGVVKVNSSIIASNFADISPDVQGAFVSRGFNLLGVSDGSTGFTNGVQHDQAGNLSAPLDPKLYALQRTANDHTVGLLCDSPAIDAGDDSVTEPPLSLATDHRGRPRRAGSHVDIGAFEFQPIDGTPPLITISDGWVTEGNGGMTFIVFNINLSARAVEDVIFNYATADGSATAGSDYEPFSYTGIINKGDYSTNISVLVNSDTTLEPDETFTITLSNVCNAAVARAQGVGTIVDDDTPRVIQLSAPAYEVNEGGGRARLNVTRTGSTFAPLTFKYNTTDDAAAVPCNDTTASPNAASARCDYTLTADTLTFASGQTQKSLEVTIVDDVHVEHSEKFNVALLAPEGVALGTVNEATVTIVDNDTGAAPNPINDNAFFVRQHYLDFLNREPEQAGFDAWMRVLEGCPNRSNFDPASPSAACDRITVSASFFNSPEFRQKAYYIYRFYRVALNRRPLYAEIIQDLRSVTGQTAFEANSRLAEYTAAWDDRSEFHARYDARSHAEYVDELLARYGATIIHYPDAPGGERIFSREGLIAHLISRLSTRGDILRFFVHSREVDAAEFNGAFVAMQYFGYLRRDAEPEGYNAWLNYLNTHPGDYRTMVNGFLNSQEYRLRFGAPQ